MKNRGVLLVSAVLGALLIFFSLAYAQPPCPPLLNLADELGLTDEQIEEIRDIQYNFKKAEIGLKADIKTLRLELHHLMMQEEPNEREIARVVERMADAEKKLLKHRVDKKLAMKKVLTAEQFEKFLKIKGEAKKMRMRKEPKCFPPHSPEFPPHGDGPGF